MGDEVDMGSRRVVEFATELAERSRVLRLQDGEDGECCELESSSGANERGRWELLDAGVVGSSERSGAGWRSREPEGKADGGDKAEDGA